MSESTAATPTLDVRKLVVRFLLAVLVLAALLVLTGFYLEEELLAVSASFVEHFGGWGVFLGFFFPDAFTLPIPQDAFMAFALVGGMSFWEVVAWATAGSLSGGSLGWLLGRQLRRTRAYARFMERRGKDAEALIERYGSIALGVGAATPLPYSILCWACGALGMSYGRFLAVSTLRFVRVVSYLWLIEIGVLRILG